MTQPPQINQPIRHLDPDDVDAFIDSELPATEQQGIELHLRNCHSCTLRVLAATQLKAATAHAGRRFAPPSAALARLTAQLHAQPPVQKSARIFTLQSSRAAAWVALAASILLAVSLLGWRQLHQRNTLAAALLAQHLATLSSGAPPQVIYTERHTVTPWFQGRLPFSFNLPDTADLPSDTTLKGADLTYLNGQPAALLLFTIHKHEVSIFLTQRSTGAALAPLPNARAGFTLHTAATPELQIIAVSNVNPADLDSLLAALAGAQ